MNVACLSEVIKSLKLKHAMEKRNTYAVKNNLNIGCL